MTPKKRKPIRFVDIRLPGVELRNYTCGGHRSRMGRTSVNITCPFCGVVFVAYVWSLPNGKRCTCGALFGARGVCYQWKSNG